MDIIERLNGYVAYNTKQSREEDDAMRAAVIEIQRLRDALEIFALDANWRLNHRCDPNSPHFDGLIVAQKALKN